MPFIGLTGGMGTGKTTVLKLFSELGACTMDADRIVHELLRKPPVRKKLVSILGKGILIKRSSTEYIQKKRMAEIIFNDPVKRKSVEGVLHPEVIKTALSRKRKIQAISREAVILFEVPLLYEAGYEGLFDKIIVVSCDRKRARERLLRSGLSEKEIHRRMKAQLPISQKKKMADYVINNDSGLGSTRRQVKTVFKELLKIS